MDHFQIIAQCLHCKVEGANMETFDQEAPCCHFGVPAETVCRMCRRQTRGGVHNPSSPAPTTTDRTLAEEVCPGCAHPLSEATRLGYRCEQCGLGAYAQVMVEPDPLVTLEQVEAALLRWATKEGYPVLDEMLEVSFGELTVVQIHALLQSGTHVPTSFDVLGFLFSNMSGGASGMQAPQVDPPSLEDTGTWDMITQKPEPLPEAAIQLPSKRPFHIRNRLLPLISVMVADGQIRPPERAFLDEVIRRDRLRPLSEHELKVHRPHEVGPVGSMQDREDLIALMIQLAHIDEEKDATEMRLIREFARTWGVDPARVDAWEAEQDAQSASALQRFLFKCKSLFMMA